VEALTAGLAGHGRSDPNARLGATLFVQVIDPAAFTGTATFQSQMDAIVDLCHANPPADPLRPVRMPGERGVGLRREQLSAGVLLRASICAPLWSWAQRLEVATPQPIEGGKGQ
jgi:LDH2 family malate/lactate/ureidoglycolate dehydrogenase